MSLSLVLSKLKSRAVRTAITGGVPRQINPRVTVSNGLVKWTQRVVNFAISLLPVVGGFAVAVWNWLVQATTAIVNFDWNASDKQIEEWMKGNNIALASTWGNAVGETAGSLAGLALGVGVSMVVPVIGGSALAKIVAGKVIEERADDVINSIRSALSQTFATMAKNAGLSLYVNIRKMLRSIPGFQDWGKEGGKPWIISEKVEEKIQGIPNEYLRAFTDSAVDQFFESFIETGYIVAASIDEQWQLHKASANNILGNESIVEIYPDPEIKEEKIVLKGGRKLLKPQINAVLANAQLVKNKDIGQLVGMPANDRVKGAPMKRQMVIVLYSKAKPPFYDKLKKKYAKRVEVSIPDYKPSLSWQQIKDAAKGYTWGKFHGIAELDNGRKLDLWAGSESEAVAKLKDFAKLTTAEVISIRVAEQKDIKNTRAKKEATKVYPVQVNFFVRKKARAGKGRATLTGDLEEERKRWELWRDKEPQGYKTP